jgi:glucokinase
MKQHEDGPRLLADVAGTNARFALILSERMAATEPT